MAKYRLTIEEIERERTPSVLWEWLLQEVDEIASAEQGGEDFRLQKGLVKKLVEEIAPLAKWGRHKFGDTDKVFLLPVIGNQNYDAKVIDGRTKPASKTYVEITQAHEGEDNYWRRCELLKKGFVPSYAPVIKEGKGKSQMVSIPPAANSVEDRVDKELDRILKAARDKQRKRYPANTSLIIYFDDTPPFQKVMSIDELDSFVRQNVLGRCSGFATLCLVGRAEEIFREYPIGGRD